jgi:DNA polymerase-3 subunit delta'
MIFGHKKNIKVISRIISENRLAHGILFTGPDGVGKRTVALEIAKYLQGQHNESFLEFSKKKCTCGICKLIDENNFPGIIEVEEAEKQLSIKKIREIKETLSMSWNYPYKIVILNKIERMTHEAAGALLKILEEPIGNTIFFLLTPMPALVLKTIQSRVCSFKFSLLSKEDINLFLEAEKTGINISEKQKIIDLSVGRPGIAKNIAVDKKLFSYYDSYVSMIGKIIESSDLYRLNLAEKIEKESNATNDFLFFAECWFRDAFLLKENYSEIVFKYTAKEIKNASMSLSLDKIKQILKEIQKTRKYLTFSNTSRLLALENLLLTI